MRVAGNAIQNYFGQLTIQPPNPGGNPLTVFQANGAGAFSVGTNGNVIVSVPVSGQSLVVNALTGLGAQVTGTSPLVQILDSGANGVFTNIQALNTAWAINFGWNSAAPGGNANLQINSVTALQIKQTAGSYSGVNVQTPAVAATTLTVNNNASVVAAFNNSTGATAVSGITFGSAANSNLSAGIAGQAATATSGQLLLQYVTGSALTTAVTITPNGVVSISAPASGNVALSVSAVSGSSAAQFFAGGVQVGAPTGGDKGAGTINVASGLFVNGVAVSSGVATLTAVATTTQSITSSTTYVADTSLTVPLLAGKYYQIFVQSPYVNASGATGGGAKFAFTYSGTAGSLWGDDLATSGALAQPQAQGGQPTTANSFQLNAANAIDSGGNIWTFFGTMYGGTVGGNLVVNWAQNSSNATATVRQIGACMTAIQLN